MNGSLLLLAVFTLTGLVVVLRPYEVARAKEQLDARGSDRETDLGSVEPTPGNVSSSGRSAPGWRPWGSRSCCGCSSVAPPGDPVDGTQDGRITCLSPDAFDGRMAARATSRPSTASASFFRRRWRPFLVLALVGVAGLP